MLIEMMIKQGLRKGLSSRPGQINCVAGEVPFILTCPLGRGPASRHLPTKSNPSIANLAQGRQKLRASPKAKLQGFKFLSSPVKGIDNTRS